ncbi:hypothetical protein LINGRAHAP2_LOCUS6512, partial [Linum grandiflorum]
GDRARYKDDLFTVLAQVDLFLKSINKPLSVVALQRDLQQSQLILFINHLALSKNDLILHLSGGIKHVKDKGAFRPGLYSCFLFCTRLSIITLIGYQHSCIDLYEDG